LLPLAAQEVHPYFEHITIENGLSQSSVTCVIQDSRGFIWCGTQDGLNRYDGYEFEIYRENPLDSLSLSDNGVNAIVEDAWGDLWVGTASGGLNCFNRYSNSFEQFLPAVQDSNSLSHIFVSALHIASPQTLWIGTSGGGMCQMDIPTRTIRQCRIAPSNPEYIYSIIPFSSQLLWLATDQGMQWYDTEGDSLISTPDVPELLHAVGEDNYISCYYKDQKGDLWLGTFNNGLIRYSPHEKRVDKWPSTENVAQGGVGAGVITAITEDSRGQIWVGSDESGLIHVDPLKRHCTQYVNDIENAHSLANNVVTGLMVDASGLLWVATESGLSKLSPALQKFSKHPLSQLSQRSFLNVDIWSFLKDSRGKLWVGTDRGVFEYLETAGKLIHHQADPDHLLIDNTVHSLLEDRQGELWFGTIYGVTRYSPKTGAFQRYYFEETADSLQGYAATAMAVDPAQSHIIWIGTMEGLNRLDKLTGHVTFFEHQPDDENSLKDSYIADIYFDKKGRMWIGTGNGGLDLYENATGRFIHHDRDTHRFHSNRITVIHEDENDIFWVGTFGGGMFRFDVESGDVKNFAVQQGLPNAVIYGIEQDRDGYLWISSNRGLSRFHRKTELFVNYDDRYGLQHDEFNQGAHYQDSEGLIYFGGVNGFNVFASQSLTINQHVPPVHFTDLKIFNQDIDISENGPLKGHISELNHINLRDTENSVTLVYAALDYHIPERNNYAIRLDPLDKDWQFIGHRRVHTLSNLRPGTYTFRVKASNSDGVWNDESTALEIHIHPPLVQTLWFRGLLLLLALMVVLAGHEYRTRLLKIRTKTLEDEVDARTTDLVDFNKQLQEQVAVRQKAEHALRVSEERYRNFVAQSSEGIYRLEFTPPVPIHLPIEEQVDWIYSQGRLAECNEVFAEMYGATIKEMIDLSMGEMHEGGDAEINREAQRVFIRNGYRVDNEETHELDANGRPIVFLNNAFGVVHQGRLLRIWGTQQDVTERKRIENQIKASLKEKDVLIKEVHHRVKNNMQIISSLLQLQSRRVDDTRVTDILKESQARVRSMALVHEMLYGSHNLSQIDFSRYVTKLVNSLYSVHGEARNPIQFEYDMENTLISVDLAVPCGLMINELVTNALKHAFPETREGQACVRISLKILETQRLQVVCCDNGVGLPESFDVDNTQSLGMFLIKILVTEQLGGSLQIEGNDGTTFILEFPFEKHQVQIDKAL